MMLKNKYRFILFLALGILLMAEISISKETTSKTIEKAVPTSFMQAKTIYQVNIFYDPKVAIDADTVIVHRHGRSNSLNSAIKSWQDKNFLVGRMFFVDSDARNIYTAGKWDGVPHPDDIELGVASNKVLCVTRPYIVPTKGWTKYLQEMTKRSLDAGAVAIMPEEPLAHSFAGYSKSFKKLWKEYYKFPWQAQDSSEIGRFLTGQLKAEQYLQLELELLKITQQYNKSKNKNVAFVIPIHSIFGNIAGSLTAPLGMSVEAKGIDGYIGQIWTGPINRSMVNYNSDNKSFFCSAYALYDYFVQLTIETDRKLWLLVDPVDDDPKHTWNEYVEWYKHSVAAMLLMSEINSYEIMPWPDRIFMPGYQTGGGTPAPEDFRIRVLAITQVLQDIPKGGEWLPINSSSKIKKNTEKIAVAIADSAMYLNKVPKLQGPYGMLMPLISRGIPVSSFVMERVQDKNYADLYKMIILSYEDFKPVKPEMNIALAEWVKRGGSLIILGSDEDELDKADYFWWHKLGYKSPVEHLIAQLNKPKALKRHWQFGKGNVLRNKISSREFAISEKASKIYLPLVKEAVKKSNIFGKFEAPGNFCMKRGDYVIAHSIKKEISMKGKFIDIFDTSLPVVDNINLNPGESGLYKDITEILRNGKKPTVLQATHRLISQEYKNKSLKFIVKGPAETPAVARLFIPGKKKINVTAVNSKGEKVKVEIKKDKETYLLKFPNFPNGVTLMVK